MDNKQLFSFENFINLNADEKELVWKWRNHDAIRKWMYNTSVIPFENHLTFIENLKNDTSKSYFLVKRSTIPMGVFSIFNVEDHVGDLGFYIGPEYLHKKLSVEFYYHVLKYIFKVLNFRKIISYALVENQATNPLYELFGFIRHRKNRMENGKISEYYYSELNVETWSDAVKTNKIIIQMLEHTKDNE